MKISIKLVIDLQNPKSSCIFESELCANKNKASKSKTQHSVYMFKNNVATKSGWTNHPGPLCNAWSRVTNCCMCAVTCAICKKLLLCNCARSSRQSICWAVLKICGKCCTQWPMCLGNCWLTVHVAGNFWILNGACGVTPVHPGYN